MTRNFLILLIIMLGYSYGFSQSKYIVYFTDKDNTSFDPYSYFDAKAIKRKLNANISINDSSDYPLNQYYVNTIKEISIETKGTSRWFNAVVCLAHYSQIEIIRSLPFVQKIETLVSDRIISGAEIDEESFADFSITLNGQTKSLGHPMFQENDYEGQEMRIAIFDVGFKGANQIDELSHIFNANHVIKAYDFVKEQNLKYNNGGSHGTMVMSCIAGMYGTRNMGLAPEAEFLLARTERIYTEFGSEEENWLFAAEWADKNGADIINSSLGYTTQRYYQHDMQGSTALVSRAANFAASKGMLVINSAGNEGSSTWKTIGAPADADSVLSVGGIEPSLGYHSSWSSYGPTADKRLKPNVSAYGVAAVSSKSGSKLNSGTSFSSPLIVGFAACAWQAHPEYTSMELFHELEKSANLYPYFDYVHGYGLPQSSYFLEDNEIIKDIKPTFNYAVQNNILEINILNTLDLEINKEEIDSLTIDKTTESVQLTNTYYVPDYVYIHIENQSGVLDSYQVIEPDGKLGGSINIEPLKGKTIRIFYKHYIEEFYVE